MLKKLTLCVLSCTLIPGAALAKTSLKELRALERQGAKVSAYFYDLVEKKVILNHNATERLSPASLTKGVLAAAVLDKWPSHHSFTTQIYATGSRKKGVLQGDIILRGSGDPYLTNEKIWFLATDVARAGIKEVRGNIVLDNGLFGNIRLDSNRKSGQKFSKNAYDAPLSAVGMNFSVLAVVTSPGTQVGSSAVTALEPYPLNSVHLSNKARTGGSRVRVGASRRSSRVFDTLTVTGNIPLNSFPSRKYRSISNPERYAGDVIRAFLKAAGVKVTGKVLVKPGASRKPSLRPLAQVEGFPVGWQVRGLLKVSNNYISDMFTILYDLKPGQKSGATLRGGSSKLKGFLRRTILGAKSHPNKKLKSLVLNSGSGLTPSNRISAADAVAVFEKMYQHNEFPSFLAGLPGPMEKGTTLSRRFKPQRFPKKVPFIRAKTGTLTQPIEAVALGGYSRTASGRWVAFAVIVNGSQRKSAFGVPRVRNAIDKDVVSILSKESSKYADK